MTAMIAPFDPAPAAPIPAIPLARVLDPLIAEHGAWRVLRAALGAALRRRREARAADAALLGDHLRRDIGLSPVMRGKPGFNDLRR